ncbi:MAG: sigma 54-interacting transcriptional regulator, partial [Oceanobacter sp.]
DTLFESELFGHEKGAFTGATHRKPGLVEAARGGTLFLDEVGDIPLDMQVKLLRLIESGTYRPVGSVTPKQADFRLICATHRNLEDQVENGEFRRDLFYRISPFPVYLPSLNARQQDILPLAQQLLKQVSSDKTFKLSETAGNWLKQQNFPGNIRELRNRLERATLLCDTGVIEVEHLTPARPPHFSGQPTTKLRTELNSAKADSNLTSAPETSASTFSLTSTSTFPETTFSEIGVLPLDQLESRYLLDISSAFEGDNAELAKQLGVSERTLYRKLKSARATKL